MTEESTTPAPTPAQNASLQASKLKAARVIGVVIVTALTGATVLVGAKYPQLATLNAAVAWLFGKLFGVPLESVMQAALRTMQPEKAVALTVSAVQSMPPAKADAVAQSVLQEIASHAVGQMGDQQAQHMARALLETIPPEAKARVLEKIVFASMPPIAADVSPPPSETKKEEPNG